ncbi:MAG: hypothetical protein AB7E37_06590 [Candidatus Altimarinota bacterium]
MYYLEVKIDKQNRIDDDTTNFISNVIKAQDNLGKEKKTDYFENEKLLELGFVYNPSTNGFSIQKEFTIKQLSELAKEISKLKNHILTHGYTELKIYEDELYFWDKSLIYEGIDTFEYCLKYHNLLKLNDLLVLTKSDTINEDLLNLIDFTRRYSTPTTEFITQNYMWDKKEGYKILKDFIINENEYLSINHAKSY